MFFLSFFCFTKRAQAPPPSLTPICNCDNPISQAAQLPGVAAVAGSALVELHSFLMFGDFVR
jgi:hypothetical protein